MIEFPDHKLKQLLTFIIHNKGSLSKRKKEKVFGALSQKEQEEIEEAVCRYFSFK